MTFMNENGGVVQSILVVEKIGGIFIVLSFKRTRKRLYCWSTLYCGLDQVFLT